MFKVINFFNIGRLTQLQKRRRTIRNSRDQFGEQEGEKEREREKAREGELMVQQVFPFIIFKGGPVLLFSHHSARSFKFDVLSLPSVLITPGVLILLIFDLIIYDFIICDFFYD